MAANCLRTQRLRPRASIHCAFEFAGHGPGQGYRRRSRCRYRVSIVLEEGFGWDNREAVKVTSHTPFSLASITKPFTATAPMTLAAEGRLALDAPANTYLADSPIRGAGRHPEAVTVRMLGAHARGLPGIFQSYGHSAATFAPGPKALLPEWQQPQETSGPVPLPFADSSKIHGHRAGTLSNDGVSMPVALTIESIAIATFALGSKAPAPITSLRLEGDAFTGKTTGSIESVNARRTHASTLGIKLLAHEGKPPRPPPRHRR